MHFDWSKVDWWIVAGVSLVCGIVSFLVGYHRGGKE